MPTTTIKIGDEAPDFELRDQSNKPVKLSDFRGQKNVLLVFYPFAFTPVCATELTALRDDIETFQNERVQLLSVSVDSPFSHRVWAEREGFHFPMLADFWPHGAVAQAYGVFNEERGCATRGTFVIDREGIVRWTVVNDIPDARDIDDYVKVLADL